GQYMVAFQPLELDAHELPRQIQMVLVVEYGLSGNRAGFAVNRSAQEVDTALQVSSAALQIGKFQHGGNIRILVLPLAAQLESILQRQLEAHFQRIQWGNGDQRRAGIDHIADIDPAQADLSCYRSRDLGVIQFDSVTLQSSLGLRDGG